MTKNNWVAASVAASVALFATNLWAHGQAPRADSHAPIGVMADHYHKAGEWMLSYRYKTMSMSGNRDGGDNLSNDDVYAQGYMVAPQKMDMQMHMLGAMYAPSDKVTFAMMLPYMQKEMQARTAMGMTFGNKTKGIGDVKLVALMPLLEENHGKDKLLASIGLSLPTGSIDERGNTPMASNVVLPYGMQLGSGTYDLRPSITYTELKDAWSWGVQWMATVRSGGANDRGYRLGNSLELQSWMAWNPKSSLSFSGRLHWQAWGNIQGADANLNPMMTPAADPKLRSGQLTNLLVGVNWLGSSRHRFAIEVGTPIQQRLDGPQLKHKTSVTAGWQYAF